MVNRLSTATSPYLLQHASNPVHWWEWGPEALAEAEARDVPVLLSVGYASCHWCHVMAHESFEDDETAGIMNELFVNVKVDREERPDVDRIYMDAVQSMTGHGGWPMTVFLTPQGRPFFAGTYFPREDRHGHPSFRTVLSAVSEAWVQRRAEVESQAETLAAAVATGLPAGKSIPGSAELARGYEAIRAVFDPRQGGFGGAPKFPQAATLEFLLRAAGKPWASEAEDMLTRTLHAMADGGIHDQVGGGFSRYAVDGAWLIPHFEKMLYDNALLARLYARAWQKTGVERFAAVARSTLDYMRRDLTLPRGGFASGEDADSEGEEGRFYVFSWEDFTADMAHEAVAEVLGATPEGNFEGSSILHRRRSVAEVAAAHAMEAETLEAALTETLERLGQRRGRRVRPGLDDKAVCAWNGLAVRAFAESGAALGEPEYVATAEQTARFILDELRTEDGRLLRAVRDGRASGPGFCDDYGAVALGLFALHQATGDPAWYAAAADITREMVELFWDDGAAGFFATGNDAERLIARPKNFFDNPTPSDNSMAAEALQHLAALSGEPDAYERLDATMLAAAALLDRHPLGAGHLLAVLLVSQEPPLEVAIVGNPEDRAVLETVVRSAYLPHAFVAVGDGNDDHGIPLLAGRPAIAPATAYVCRGFVCDAPVTTADSLTRAISAAAQPD